MTYVLIWACIQFYTEPQLIPFDIVNLRNQHPDTGIMDQLSVSESYPVGNTKLRWNWGLAQSWAPRNPGIRPATLVTSTSLLISALGIRGLILGAWRVNLKGLVRLKGWSNL